MNRISKIIMILISFALFQCSYLKKDNPKEKSEAKKDEQPLQKKKRFISGKW